MKRTVSFIFTFGLLASLTFGVIAHDMVKVSSKNSKVRHENDHVRAVEVTLAPGEKMPEHTHPAHLVYVVSDGKIRVAYTGGKTEEMSAKAGDVLWFEPEGPHTTENIGTTPVKFLVVELKDRPYKGETQDK